MISCPFQDASRLRLLKEEPYYFIGLEKRGAEKSPSTSLAASFQYTVSGSSITVVLKSSYSSSMTFRL
jgi:hypothetical protein